MAGDVFTFLVAGKAGEGVKKTGSVAAGLFAGMGRHVFLMDDYQSIIRGGHNFTVVSTATRPLTSHYARADVMVTLDKRSYERRAADMAPGGILFYNSDTMTGVPGVGLPLTAEAKKYPNPDMKLGVGAIAALAAALGLNRNDLTNHVKREYRRDAEDNVAYASAVYEHAYGKIGRTFSLSAGGARKSILSGNEAICLGAAAGGLDVFFAYPMTPVSNMLHYLAGHDRELGIAVIHPENEIGVINMAIGATFAGARAMIASSGGGFALMQEAFSLAGMVESPLLCVLGSRPGPSTGMATYTEQADLNFALNQGHGEFPRIVASPGTIEEAFHLAASLLHLAWQFQTPAILLTEKHLTESEMTVDIDARTAQWPDPVLHGGGEYRRFLDTESGVSPLLFPPAKELIKWNSNEHDEVGFTTDNPLLATKMHDKRARKRAAIVEHLRKKNTVNVFGGGDPVIFTYGSTTMSVLEALRAGGIEATVIQPVYLEPLPVWEMDKYGTNGCIVVEQSSTGQFESLLRERARIHVKTGIRKYDGRPFDPDDLAAKIKEAL